MRVAPARAATCSRSECCAGRRRASRRFSWAKEARSGSSRPCRRLNCRALRAKPSCILQKTGRSKATCAWSARAAWPSRSKEETDEGSQQQREDTVREMIKAHMSTAELSNIQIENVTDPVKPFVYSFHIKVQGYAQKTRRPLFLQPAFFQHGLGSLFQTSERAIQSTSTSLGLKTIRLR